MQAIIIDDLPLAIASLRQDLEDYCPDIEVIATADGVIEGSKLLRKIKPDLLFLDVQMGDGDGFDLLDIIDTSAFPVIFTTASEDYAIKAFQYAAVDYLLKPMDPELLVQAVEKAKLKPQLSDQQKNIIKNNAGDTRAREIALNTQEEIRVVALADIIRCTSMDNYTQFFITDGSKVLVTKTLKQYERMLPEEMFLRVHQSHLVNISKIQSYIKTEGGYLLLKNGEHIPVSVRKKPMVMDLLLKGRNAKKKT